MHKFYWGKSRASGKITEMLYPGRCLFKQINFSISFISLRGELQLTQQRHQEIAMFFNIQSTFPLAFLPDSVLNTLVPSGDVSIFLLMNWKPGRWVQSQCPAFRQRKLGVNLQPLYTTGRHTSTWKIYVYYIPFQIKFCTLFLLCMGKKGNWGQQKKMPAEEEAYMQDAVQVLRWVS